MSQRERGAALVETAIGLPVILLALYGVTWGIRAGTVSERAETAVRYAGVISAEQNPYLDYSLYTLYNNLGASSDVPTQGCSAPSTLYLSGGTLPVTQPGTPASEDLLPSFWQPDSGSIQAYCAATATRQVFTGNTRSYLLLQSSPIMAATVSDAAYFLDAKLSSAIETEYKFYRSADLSSVMHCAAAVGGAVSSSLNPALYGAGTRITPLQSNDFDSQPVAISANCGAGIGAPKVPPTPVPFNPVSGTIPSAPPANPGSPTPAPSPNPTKTPATPAPSTTPSAAASPTPKASSSPGGGGGSGGSGGTPLPSPTPGGGGTPKPSGSPTGKPTGQPTTTPATPAPTAKPATPKPTTSPTTSPTTKPVPSPSPAQPPGSIS